MSFRHLNSYPPFFLVQILFPETSAFLGVLKNCNGKTAQDWAVRYSESR